jgi:hypothetical protein
VRLDWSASIAAFLVLYIILVIGHCYSALQECAFALDRSILILPQEFPLQINDLADVMIGVAGATQERCEAVFGFGYPLG